MSQRYCSNSQLSRNGGVTSSISDSEKSVVMLSLVSGAPRAEGCGDWTIAPSGDTRRDSFSTPLRPPRSTPRSPELMSPARRRSKVLSTTLRNNETPRGTPTGASRLGYLNPCQSRQLRNDLYLHEEAGIHQTLHLHPRGSGQTLFVVV